MRRPAARDEKLHDVHKKRKAMGEKRHPHKRQKTATAEMGYTPVFKKKRKQGPAKEGRGSKSNAQSKRGGGGELQSSKGNAIRAAGRKKDLIKRSILEKGPGNQGGEGKRSHQRDRQSQMILAGIAVSSRKGGTEGSAIPKKKSKERVFQREEKSLTPDHQEKSAATTIRKF